MSHKGTSSLPMGLGEIPLPPPPQLGFPNSNDVKRNIIAVTPPEDTGTRISAEHVRFLPLAHTLVALLNDDDASAIKLSLLLSCIYMLRLKIMSSSQDNHILERQVASLDHKIKLLIQQTNTAHTNTSEPAKKAEVTQMITMPTSQRLVLPYLPPITELPALTILPTISHHHKIVWEQIMFVLQQRPQILSHLARCTSMQNGGDTLVEMVVLELMGDQDDATQERLLIELFSTALRAEFNANDDQSTLLRGNSPLTHMLSTFARRGKGVGVLQTVLKPPIQAFCNEKATAVTLTFDSCIAAANLPPLSRDSAPLTIDTLPPEAMVIYYARLSRFKQLIASFFDSIMNSVNMLPKGVRWVARYLYYLCLHRYPDDNDHFALSIVGGFVCLRYFNPCIVSPQIIEAVNTDPSPVHRRGLIIIAKVIQNISNALHFKSNEPHLIPLNAYIDEKIPQMRQYLRAVTDVSDFTETLSLNKYLAHSGNASIIQTTTSNIYRLQHLLWLHFDSICTRYRDQYTSDRQQLKAQGTFQYKQQYAHNQHIKDSDNHTTSPSSPPVANNWPASLPNELVAGSASPASPPSHLHNDGSPGDKRQSDISALPRCTPHPSPGSPHVLQPVPTQPTSPVHEVHWEPGRLLDDYSRQNRPNIHQNMVWNHPQTPSLSQLPGGTSRHHGPIATISGSFVPHLATYTSSSARYPVLASPTSSLDNDDQSDFELPAHRPRNHKATIGDADDINAQGYQPGSLIVRDSGAIPVQYTAVNEDSMEESSDDGSDLPDSDDDDDARDADADDELFCDTCLVDDDMDDYVSTNLAPWSSDASSPPTSSGGHSTGGLRRHSSRSTLGSDQGSTPASGSSPPPSSNVFLHPLSNLKQLFHRNRSGAPVNGVTQRDVQNRFENSLKHSFQERSSLSRTGLPELRAMLLLLGRPPPLSSEQYTKLKHHSVVLRPKDPYVENFFQSIDVDDHIRPPLGQQHQHQQPPHNSSATLSVASSSGAASTGPSAISETNSHTSSGGDHAQSAHGSSSHNEVAITGGSGQRSDDAPATHSIPAPILPPSLARRPSISITSISHVSSQRRHAYHFIENKHRDQSIDLSIYYNTSQCCCDQLIKQGLLPVINLNQTLPVSRTKSNKKGSGTDGAEEQSPNDGSVSANSPDHDGKADSSSLDSSSLASMSSPTKQILCVCASSHLKLLGDNSNHSHDSNDRDYPDDNRGDEPSELSRRNLPRRDVQDNHNHGQYLRNTVVCGININNIAYCDAMIYAKVLQVVPMLPPLEHVLPQILKQLKIRCPPQASQYISSRLPTSLLLPYLSHSEEWVRLNVDPVFHIAIQPFVAEAKRQRENELAMLTGMPTASSDLSQLSSNASLSSLSRNTPAPTTHTGFASLSNLASIGILLPPDNRYWTPVFPHHLPPSLRVREVTSLLRALASMKDPVMPTYVPFPASALTLPTVEQTYKQQQQQQMLTSSSSTQSLPSSTSPTSRSRKSSIISAFHLGLGPLGNPPPPASSESNHHENDIHSCGDNLGQHSSPVVVAERLLSDHSDDDLDDSDSMGIPPESPPDTPPMSHEDLSLTFVTPHSLSNHIPHALANFHANYDALCPSSPHSPTSSRAQAIPSSIPRPTPNTANDASDVSSRPPSIRLARSLSSRQGHATCGSTPDHDIDLHDTPTLRHSLSFSTTSASTPSPGHALATRKPLAPPHVPPQTIPNFFLQPASSPPLRPTNSGTSPSPPLLPLPSIPSSQPQPQQHHPLPQSSPSSHTPTPPISPRAPGSKRFSVTASQLKDILPSPVSKGAYPRAIRRSLLAYNIGADAAPAPIAQSTLPPLVSVSETAPLKRHDDVPPSLSSHVSSSGSHHSGPSAMATPSLSQTPSYPANGTPKNVTLDTIPSPRPLVPGLPAQLCISRDVATLAPDVVRVPREQLSQRDKRVAGWVNRWLSEHLTSLRYILLDEASERLKSVIETNTIVNTHSNNLKDRVEAYTQYLDSIKNGATSLSSSALFNTMGRRQYIEHVYGFLKHACYYRSSAPYDYLSLSERFKPYSRMYTFAKLVRKGVICNNISYLVSTIQRHTLPSPMLDIAKLRDANFRITEIRRGEYSFELVSNKVQSLLPIPVVFEVDDLMRRTKIASTVWVQAAQRLDRRIISPSMSPVDLQKMGAMRTYDKPTNAVTATAAAQPAAPTSSSSADTTFIVNTGCIYGLDSAGLPVAIACIGPCLCIDILALLNRVVEKHFVHRVYR